MAVDVEDVSSNRPTHRSSCRDLDLIQEKRAENQGFNQEILDRNAGAGLITKTNSRSHGSLSSAAKTAATPLGKSERVVVPTMGEPEF